MSRMLLHVPTGDLYVFTSILAKRSDMELVPEEEPVAEVSEPVIEEVVEAKPLLTKKAGKQKVMEVQSVEPLSIDIEE